jgi:hypothetical protein
VLASYEKNVFFSCLINMRNSRTYFDRASNSHGSYPAFIRAHNAQDVAPWLFIAHLTAQLTFPMRLLIMGSDSSANTPSTLPPAVVATPANDANRTKSIATRLTETEFIEVESAALRAGQKVSEWLRETALSRARNTLDEDTDPILLAEIVGLRSLVLNLFAKASEGPIDTDDMRKISAYADSVKRKKAAEVLHQARQNERGTEEK